MKIPLRPLRLLPALLPLLPLGLGAQDLPPAQDEVVVTILFDNFLHDADAPPPGMGTGWGFAALVETGGHTVLFDTGADGAILLENLRLLGKDPMAIEAVVISHAHGDHTSGLPALVALGLRPRLYLLGAFPAEARGWAAGIDQVVETTPGQEIVPGIRTTGQVGTTIPEQALLLDVAEGTVILTGCAHPGPAEMARGALAVSDRPLHAILGGFHLAAASPEVVQGVMATLREMEIARVGATHCTGEEAMRLFQEEWGEGYERLGVGRILRFRVPASAGTPPHQRQP